MEEKAKARVIVILSEQHRLFAAQTELLDKTFHPHDWDILSVPSEGWTLEEISVLATSFRQNGWYHIVFASPVPALLAKLAHSREDERPLVWAFHNDVRVSKEIPDGAGGVRLIKTVSPTGWRLVC
jgi:hypothetical protein